MVTGTANRIEAPINFRQLQYFARIVETGNMTRAAEQLYVAQPALGLQIKQMEEALGVSLLHRHSRGVEPTRAGRLLYERACEILRLVDEAERQVIAAGRQEREGILLGLTNGFANVVGRDLVQQARQDIPDVSLSLVEERSVVLVDALERHEIDIALAYEVHERPGLLRVPLLEEETLFVSRGEGGDVQPLQSVPSIEFSEIARHALVMPGPRDGVRQQVLATARRLAVDLNVTLDVSSISMMKNMVAMGDACAVMPYGNVAEDIASGRIRGRRIVNPPLRRTLYLVRPHKRAPFQAEAGVLRLMSQVCRLYAERLGPLAAPLEALATPEDLLAAAHPAPAPARP
ncbi:LysR family transcriptional regulator [Ramlibacter sp. MAHUQ-53]|uniref:LysR family transcriptional regulator n=1 Tax=unclassified Ramlibacter TaxID=2617605 RepID=UPI003638B02E